MVRWKRCGALAIAVACMTVVVAGCTGSDSGSETTAHGADACALLGPAQKAGTKEPGVADDTELFSKVLAKAPSEIAEDLRFLDDLTKKYKDNPEAMDKSLAPKITESSTRLLEWTAKNCPSFGPYWACLTQSKFTPVAAIDEPTPSAPVAAATPEAALSASEKGTNTREVSRTDTLVEFAALDGNGRVTNIREVRKEGAGWVASASRSCKK